MRLDTVSVRQSVDNLCGDRCRLEAAGPTPGWLFFEQLSGQRPTRFRRPLGRKKVGGAAGKPLPTQYNGLPPRASNGGMAWSKGRKKPSGKRPGAR
ncbi:hypothetical protein D3C80_1493540 [compost metagenome]